MKGKRLVILAVVTLFALSLTAILGIPRLCGSPVCGVEITNVLVSHCGDLVNGAYKTWTVNVSVTVHNNGTVQTNCTVSAYYYNATVTQLIGTSQNVTNLDPCNTTTLIFSWNFLSLPVGNTYTVKANITCTCGANDELVNGQVKKRLWCDINDSGHVSLSDVGKLDLVYSGWSQGPNIDPYCDINGDCKVSFYDVGKMACFMQPCIPPPPFP